MTPDFVDVGSPWKVLPPGIHIATMDEIKDRFAISNHREKLFAGFKKGVEVLLKAGCCTVFLDGSFITEKPAPKDYDACWDPIGVNVSKLDPVLLDFSNNRKKQKSLYFGEFFPSSSLADGVHLFSEFFQIDKYTGKPKGILNLLLLKKPI